MILYPDGFGGTAGDDPLVTADSIYIAGDGGADVYHVNSATGNDTTGAGTRNSPYATVGKALSLASAYDVIVVHAGHEETIATTATISVRVIIIGEGEGDDRPLLTPNIASNTDMWTLTGSPIIRNLRFGAALQANTSPTIDASDAGASYTDIAYCEFSCGEYDAGNKVAFNTSGRLFSCDFISTATAYSGRPSRAVASPLWTWGCTFAGGTYGWQSTQTLVHGWDNTASGPVGININGACQIEVTDGAYVEGAYYHFPDGLGMIGHPLIANEGLYLSSVFTPYYVDSQTGSDSAGYGVARDRPYATLKYAINTGGANGIFIVAAGHTETIITATIAVDQITAWIIGEGEGDNRPLFTRGYDGIAITLDTNATRPHLLANVRLAESTVSSTATRVSVTEALAVIHNCEFECGEMDQGSSVTFGADGVSMWSCSFTSVETTITTLPVNVITGTYSSSCRLLDCSFDGGAKGWASALAVSFDGFDLFAENLSLLRDSRFYAAESGGYATGFDCFIQIGAMTGNSGVTIG
jgi:hypothetical protein